MHGQEPIKALVALGSNIGDSREIILRAFQHLRPLSATSVMHSSLWTSEPVDCPPGSPAFVNAAAVLTPLPGETPESLLGKLQRLEVAFGRVPKLVLNEPRPLDLDLVAFGRESRASAALILPHPRAVTRAFVLKPLAEIAAEVVMPGQTLSISQLASKVLDASTLRDSNSSPGTL